MLKELLIILILCSQDVWLPILDPRIEYPVMERLHIIMHNVINTNVKHHVGPVVDTSCYHDGIFVHLFRAIESSLIPWRVTLQMWPLTTLDMLVVLPISFRSSDAKNFWCHSATNQSQDLGSWLYIHIVPYIWFSIFDGRTFPYVCCCEWTCPGSEYLILNPQLVNSLTQFLWLLVTVQFTDHSNHCYMIFRGVVPLHIYKTKLDYFNNDKL